MSTDGHNPPTSPRDVRSDQDSTPQQHVPQQHVERAIGPAPKSRRGLIVLVIVLAVTLVAATVVFVLTRPGSSAPNALSIGETSGNEVVAVTVHEFQHPLEPGLAGGLSESGAAPPPADMHLDGIDVEVCLKADRVDTTVNSSPWTLVDAANHRFRSVLDADGALPGPEYPWTDLPLSNGDCVRGWMLFEVPPNIEVAAIIYSPTPSVRGSVRWDVP